ncbi:hypothetical protein SNE35_22745 [Paucibacter sp. R3-3]|uniref:Uncharacterized protein n=1 Tax=Roseateles agri TaxID=3098619 RepID=A0ABU5DMG5_9BURK|nr:hypothetical protein [Paucibacter sp. R3-3]MDY0747339.1 hypothetical protein [Paucibacter sp. R3-3]
MAHRTRRPHKRHFVERMAGEAPDASPIEIALNRIALLTRTEREHIMGPRQLALAEFRAGRGSEDHWRELADAFNVGADLVEHQIASDHAVTFDTAKTALAAVMTRQQAGGNWTLRGAELAAIDLAVFVHQVQLTHCSRGELAQAVSRTIARIRNVLAGQVPSGAHVFTPGALGAKATEGQCA